MTTATETRSGKALDDGPAAAIRLDSLRYYDFRRRWTEKIVPYLADARLNAVLVRDFNKFTYGLWRESFLPGDLPGQFESFEAWDWRLRHHRPYPRYWDYAKHSACYWIVNFCLGLATLAEPARPWRIIWSDRHATVWDGKLTLFDVNFSALGVSPRESFSLAYEHELPPGRLLKVFYTGHYSEE